MTSERNRLMTLAADALDRGARTDDVVLMLISGGMDGGQARVVVEQLGGGRIEIEKLLPGLLLGVAGLGLVALAVAGIYLTTDSASTAGTRSAIKILVAGIGMVMTGGGMAAKAL